MWLDGYYTDEEDPAVIDFDKMKATAEKLAPTARRTRHAGVLTAAEDVIGK